VNKTCSQCGVWKPISEFHKNKSQKDGHHNVCKICRKQNKKKFYRDNRETCLKKSSAYQKNNRDKRNIYQKDYYFKNRVKHILYQIRQRCNNPNSDAYQWYGSRGIECRITEDELKELWFRDKAFEMEKPSIDREDNDGHYEIGNCRFIEMAINRIKDNQRPILQFDQNQIYLMEFDSIKSASKLFNIFSSNIVDCCKNRVKTAGGFIWRYKHEDVES